MPNRTLTNRGFELIEFRDRYGKLCQLQQSSLADFEPPGSSAVWLGLDDERMHLDLEQVRWLIAELQHWTETGRFRSERPEQQPSPQD